MRFMMLMIPKGYEKAAPGAMPDAKAVEAMSFFVGHWEADSSARWLSSFGGPSSAVPVGSSAWAPSS